MVVELLNGKTGAERAEIKSAEIARLDLLGRYTDKQYKVSVEIQSIEKIDGGVQAFIRAWKGKKQLGFGVDGSVEIERVRIYNPPILVPDARAKGGFREDLGAAVRSSLAHTVHVVGKEGSDIQIGKVGKTITTVYPDAGDPGANTIDGRCMYNGVGVTFATLRASNGTDADLTTAASGNVALIEATTTTDQYDSLRCWFGNFLTSAIGSDTINSATLSLFGTAKTNGFTTIDSALHIISTNTAADNTLAASDFQTRGTTSFGSITHDNFSTSAYNDITLNASGIANINGSGVSKFASTLGCDVNNTAPTWVSAAVCSMSGNYADEAGTTNDPKLVMDHGGVAGAVMANLLLMGVG